MKIRCFSRGDEKRVEEIHRKAIRKISTEYYDEEQKRSWMGIDKEKDDKYADEGEEKVERVVAEKEGSVVGYGGVNLTEGEIIGLYVDPYFSGQGIGSKILYELESKSKTMFYTVPASANAMEFYQKNGYTVYHTGMYELWDGTEIKYFEMIKRV